MPLDRDPIDPTHEYRLITSDSPVADDGYWPGEPKEIECEHCDARMVITPDPTPGLWTVTHEPHCPNASTDD